MFEIVVGVVLFCKYWERSSERWGGRETERENEFPDRQRRGMMDPWNGPRTLNRGFLAMLHRAKEVWRYRTNWKEEAQAVSLKRGLKDGLREMYLMG